MKLFLNKTFVNNMFLLKKNVKYFSSIYLLFNKVCLFGGAVNGREIVFRDALRIIFHIDFKCGSINFRKRRKQQAIYQHLDIAHLTLYFAIS